MARGGSKGLPRKNLRKLGGRPLVTWSIQAARESQLLDRAILSTDDDEIMDAARAAGGDVPFRRPPELATDTADPIEVLDHALRMVKDAFDIVVLLQATSPLRCGRDIDDGLRQMAAASAPACVSVCRPNHSPYLLYQTDEVGRLRPLIKRPAGAVRRQDFPDAWLLNGAFYSARVQWLRQTRTFVTEDTVAFVMPPERSVDIDDELDLALAQVIVSDSWRSPQTKDDAV